MSGKRRALLAGSIHFIFTFFTDNFTFYYPQGVVNWINYLFCKTLLFMILFVVWNILLNREFVYYEIFRKTLRYSVPIIPILGIAMILAWPANIAWGDMVKIYNSTSYFSCAYKYNWVTSYFHIISRMICPFVVGPMLISGMIYILLCGTITKNLEETYGKIARISYIFWVLPSNVFYALYPNRMPLFSMCYLGLWSIIVLDYYRKKTLSKAKYALIIALGTLLAYWRKECIFMVLLLPLVIIIAYGQEKQWKLYWKHLVICIFVFSLYNIPQLIGTYQNSDIFEKEQKAVICNYNLVALVYEGVDRTTDCEEWGIIEKYMDLNVVDKLVTDKGRDCLGEAYANWDSGYYAWLVNKETDDLDPFFSACYKLFASNLLTFLKAKVDQFIYVASDTNCFYGLESYNTILSTYDGHLHLVMPLSEKAHKIFIYLFSHYKGFNVNRYIDSVYFVWKDLAYNLYFPIVLLVLGGYSSIKKKDILCVLVYFLMLVHGGCVFLMAPGGYFMYWYPMYLTSCFLGISNTIRKIRKVRVED